MQKKIQAAWLLITLLCFPSPAQANPRRMRKQSRNATQTLSARKKNENQRAIQPKRNTVFVMLGYILFFFLGVCSVLLYQSNRQKKTGFVKPRTQANNEKSTEEVKEKRPQQTEITPPVMKNPESLLEKIIEQKQEEKQQNREEQKQAQQNQVDLQPPTVAPSRDLERKVNLSTDVKEEPLTRIKRQQRKKQTEIPPLVAEISEDLWEKTRQEIEIAEEDKVLLQQTIEEIKNDQKQKPLLEKVTYAYWEARPRPNSDKERKKKSVILDKLICQLIITAKLPPCLINGKPYLWQILGCPYIFRHILGAFLQKPPDGDFHAQSIEQLLFQQDRSGKDMIDLAFESKEEHEFNSVANFIYNDLFLALLDAGIPASLHYFKKLLDLTVARKKETDSLETYLLYLKKNYLSTHTSHIDAMNYLLSNYDLLRQNAQTGLPNPINIFTQKDNEDNTLLHFAITAMGEAKGDEIAKWQTFIFALLDKKEIFDAIANEKNRMNGGQTPIYMVLYGYELHDDTQIRSIAVKLIEKGVNLEDPKYKDSLLRDLLCDKKFLIAATIASAQKEFFNLHIKKVMNDTLRSAICHIIPLYLAYLKGWKNGEKVPKHTMPQHKLFILVNALLQKIKEKGYQMDLHALIPAPTKNEYDREELIEEISKSI